MLKGVIIYLVSAVVAAIVGVIGIVAGSSMGDDTGGILALICMLLAAAIYKIGSAVAVGVAASAKGQNVALGA
ncbi:MAG: hypothetical protein ACREIV_02530, partial [Planctomycetaceae bacterium]